MKSNLWSETLKPIVVLTVICIIASLALGFTNELTAPLIEQANLAAAEATRKEMLPNATSFSEIPCEVGNVNSVFKDDGGTGYVIVASANGYGGAVGVTVGFDASGKIIAVKVDASGETATVGGKTALPAFTDSFVGLTGDANSVDTISGATISSKAVIKAVNAALEAYNAVKEG